MDNIETSWDTEETSRIIANDEGLYEIALGLERQAYSIYRLSQMLEDALSDIIYNYPHSDVNIGMIDWCEIASEYTEVD